MAKIKSGYYNSKTQINGIPTTRRSFWDSSSVVKYTFNSSHIGFDQKVLTLPQHASDCFDEMPLLLSSRIRFLTALLLR